MSRVSIAAEKSQTSHSSSHAKAAGSKQKAGNSRNATGNNEDRYQMIATAAYFRAEQRGFAGGNPVDEWLAAETEIEQLYH